MRILIVSYAFPPYNGIGAVRLGKMAKYLIELGHDIRVLTAADQPVPATLPLEIPAEAVSSTPRIDLHKPAERAVRTFAGNTPKGDVPRGKAWQFLRKRVWSVYRNVLCFPDTEAGWFPYGYRAGSRLIRSWRPDVIYASGMPFTSLVVGHALARRHRVPWVGELRDLWTDNPYATYPPIRRQAEARLERRVLGSAAGLVTISEPLADVLRTKYDAPVKVVLNGFDAEDFPPAAAAPAGQLLRIVYTGMIYEGRRDPSALFEALGRLGPLAEHVRVEFYGPYLHVVEELASKFGVRRLVTVNASVPYSDALRLQSEADVLLLLLWNDPREQGTYTGKLFEYLGARRPILGLGKPDGVAGELITSRDVGVVVNTPEAVELQLRAWIRAKMQDGGIASPRADAVHGLSRREQAAKLEAFLREVVGQSEGAMSA